MSLDIDALVTEISEEEPSGPDLYGDMDRQLIEQAFDRAVGEEASTDDTDWRDVLGRIKAQGEQTRDLWLPVYFMRAGAKAGQLETVVDGSQWLARLLEDRWSDVHPQLDEVGFIGRKTPCESLTRPAEFLIPLRRVPLLTHERLGSFTGEDFERFADEGSSAENYGMYRTVIEELGFEPLEQAVEQLDGLSAAIRQIDAVLTANAEGDTATNFETTYAAILSLREALRSQLPEEEEPEAEAADDGGEGAAGVAPAAGGKSFTGGISSRADVEKALDAICLYYERHEPGSPVPFALRRARDWINLDFMAVLEDIAPGGLGEAGQVLNKKDAGSAETTDNSGGWD